MQKFILFFALLFSVHVSAQTTIAKLRVEASSDGYHVYADNTLPAPIEVRLTARQAKALNSQPELPARASVPASGSTLVAIMQPTRGVSGLTQLQLQAVQGSSNAQPQDVEYLSPIASATPQIDQGFKGQFSHEDSENRYALDFAIPEGTPILAAREGVVMQVQTSFSQNGLDYAKDASKSNYIRILHDDGSMGLYAHLAERSALVQVGDRVRAGQRIARSGNTGFSTGPHLHFAVQVNREMQLESIPFRMQGL